MEAILNRKPTLCKQSNLIKVLFYLLNLFVVYMFAFKKVKKKYLNIYHSF